MYSREGACWKAGNERGGTQTSAKEGETENKKDKIAKSEKNGGVCAPVWVFSHHISSASPQRCSTPLP